jgi:hypothetical protein
MGRILWKKGVNGGAGSGTTSGSLSLDRGPFLTQWGFRVGEYFV